MDAEDQNLWSALVDAEREVAKLRAAIHDKDARVEILSKALDAAATTWDQRVAMNYLRAFPREITQFITPLFDYSVGGKWEILAREVLAAGVRAEVAPDVSQRALEFLPKSEPDEYLQLAALLAALEAGDALSKLSSDARRREDPEIREAGEFIAQRYRWIISSSG